MRDRVSSRGHSKARIALLVSAALGVSLSAVPAYSQDAEEEAAEAAPVDGGAIIVTGSRLSTSGFTAPTPVTVMDADRIAKTGATNVGEALAQLPAFRPSATPNTANIFPANAGARIADLRGLGPSRTLVLVDGRRFTPSTSTGTIDLNMIPTLLVRSSEIVTGGASAAYGSDAVSGVINLRLDTHLQGIKAVAGYGITNRDDGENYTFQLAGGTSFAEGRGHVVVGGEYNKDKGTGGCYTRNFCGNEVGDLTGTPGFQGRPAHNIVTGMRTSSLTPGGVITGYISASDPNNTRVPARGSVLGGIQFAPDGSPTEFVYGQYAGALFMQGGSGEGLNAFFGDPLLSIPVERYNAFAHAEYEFSPAFTGFIEASYGHVEGFTRGPEIRDANNTLIHIDNPFLPDSIKDIMVDNGYESIVIGKLGTDFGNIDSTSTRDTYRIVAGGEGEIADGWNWDAHIQYGKTDYAQVSVNNRITARYAKAIDAVDVGNGPVCRVNADANPNNDDPACVALNILGQGQWSDAAKNYAFGTTYLNNEYTQLSGALNVQGTLFDNWAGPVVFATGVEARRNTLDIQVDPIAAANGFYVFNQTPSSGETSVIEGYAEIGVPLLTDSPLGESLELNAAIRQAHYTNSSPTSDGKFDATTWKVGATYRPVDAVMLRATYSRDFRAPNAVELFTSPLAGQGAFYDPFKQGEYFTRTLTGGNINLKPETAKTFTAGLTIQPEGALSGLRFSLDYYDISVRDAIGTLSAPAILNSCFASNGTADICSLITRNDQGLLDTISLLYVNVNQQKLRGIDVELGYNIPFGEEKSLDLRVLATRTLKFNSSAVVDPISGKPANRAGDNGPSGMPSWVIDGFASLDLGRLGLSLQGRYLSAGKVDATLVGPEDDGYDITKTYSINVNRVPSRFYTNIGVTFDLIETEGKTVELFANVNNVFDVQPPPFWNGNNNAVFYDNVGRRYRMGVRANF